MKKLVSFEEFDSNNWKNIKEGIDDGIEEIVPEGLPGLPENEGDAIENIKDFLEDDPSDDVVEDIVNELRIFLDDDILDELDDKHDGDWTAWILDVIDMQEITEEGLNNVMEIINNPKPLIFDEEDEDEFEGLPDDVECPDCDGTGQDDEGEECERCGGSGREYRPDDIPPD
jgi:hypothetical protein